MFASKRFFVRRQFLGVDNGDRRIEFGSSTGSAREMLFDPLLERTRGTTIQVCGLKAEDVEPGWHKALVVMLSLDSASIRLAEQRRDSLGVARDSSTRPP